MPKRKSSDLDFEYLTKKLKKIEKELHRGKRRHRRRVIFSSSSSSSDSSARQSDVEDCVISEPEVLDSGTSMANSDANEHCVVDAASEAAAPAEDIAAPAATPAPVPAPVAAATTALASPNAVAPSTSTENAEPEFDSDILDILGIDPNKTIKFGKDIQKDLAVRFEHISTTGLTKEMRKELTDKYLIPANCKLANAPDLNPEIKAALSEIIAKRDKAIESKQKVLALAISSLGEALTTVLSSKDKNTDLIKLLMDTGRILCDCQHSDSITRRNFILSSLKKEMKEQLQNTKVDSLLFGQNFSDTLKTAKAITKSGAELKANPTPKKGSDKKTASNTSKNWKTPAGSRKPAPAATAGPRGAASRPPPRAGSSRTSRTQRATHTRR